MDNTTDYVGNIEYKNQSIEAIYHAEGRITFKRSEDESGSMKPIPEYYLKDHLGNVRVVFSDLNANGYLEPFAFDPDWPVLGDPQAYEPSELLQENHYYPFGMEMEGPWELSVSAPENKYTYNGKEMQSDFGLDMLDYGARFYDPTIGRFIGVDPLSADLPAWSPYNYVLGNPIGMIDPDGRWPFPFDKGKIKQGLKKAWKSVKNFFYNDVAGNDTVGATVAATELATEGKAGAETLSTLSKVAGPILDVAEGLKIVNEASKATTDEEKTAVVQDASKLTVEIGLGAMTGAAISIPATVLINNSKNPDAVTSDARVGDAAAAYETSRNAVSDVVSGRVQQREMDAKKREANRIPEQKRKRARQKHFSPKEKALRERAYRQQRNVRKNKN